MRFLLSNLSLPLGDEKRPIDQLLSEALGGGPEDYRDAVLLRQSLDARHKCNIRFLVTLGFETARNLEGLPLPTGARLDPAPPEVLFSVDPAPKRPRVVVVGTGPAGTFCALRLLDYGITPILLERGAEMPERVRAANRLWTDGILDETSNAQFGEGGAGTFSDGKLTTRIGHPAIAYVIDTFVNHGASPKVRYLAKPHVGTDVIRGCMVRLRKAMIARGAEYRFKQKLVDFKVVDGRITAAILDSGEELPCDALVLATGHSARDTMEMLHRQGVAMRPKAFAMGLRIEHSQELIDRTQYGPSRGHESLPPADYKLVHNFDVARSAYSFCMCPGGHVIQCSSEAGGIVVNGMSNAKRDSGYANSGLVAKVNPVDFGSDHPLAGMHFQRSWEQAAFRAADNTYGAPAQRVADYLKGKVSRSVPKSTFRPMMMPGNLATCLPEIVNEQLRGALPAFDKKMHGYVSHDALLIGIESRTSCPIQLARNDDGQSASHAGLYPCGEGAGFAGGITSAAVDGIRVAEWIARMSGAPVYEPFEKRVKMGDVATDY